MDNKLIITITLTTLTTGILAPFSKSIFDKIFAAYNPDPKKINSGIRKILIFIFSYIMPTCTLIYLFVTVKKVDKFFVLMTSFMFLVILFNITIDLIFYILDKFVSPRFDIVFKTQIKQEEKFSLLIELIDNHVKLTKDIVDLEKKEDKNSV